MEIFHCRSGAGPKIALDLAGDSLDSPLQDVIHQPERRGDMRCRHILLTPPPANDIGNFAANHTFPNTVKSAKDRTMQDLQGNATTPLSEGSKPKQKSQVEATCRHLPA